MNIAILGGSFDPPHKGHVAVAKKLLKLFNFDEVWFMPCFSHPFNKPSTESVLGKNLSASDKRLEMTQYFENDNVRVSDLEIRKKTISYTIDTLRFLTNKRPQDKFCWVIGTDQVKDFTKWKDWKEIVNKFKLIIVPRTNFKKAQKQLKNIANQVVVPKNIVLINRREFPPIYISSVLIRKRVRDKKSISNFVPKKVEEYIIQNKLYL